MDWRSERQKLQIKEDRGHFGLAASVLAAYGIALAVLLDGWHPRNRGMMDFRFVAIIFFMNVGAVGVYLAWATAMRWPPFQPKQMDTILSEKIEGIYFTGLQMFQSWERNQKAGDFATSNASADALKDWRATSEEEIASLLGRDTANRYKMGAEPTQIPPDWAQRHDWVGLWAAARGRLVWLRTWLRNQTEL
jgi:hypothetical protein